MTNCAPNTLINGTVEYSTVPINESGAMRYELGTVASFACNAGFILIGFRERMCIDNTTTGVWTREPPICEGMTVNYF